MYDPLIINPTMTLGGKQAAFAASADGMSLKLTHVQFGTGVYDPTGTETAMKRPVGSKITLAGGTRPTQYQIRMLAAWREDLGGETPITEIAYFAGSVLAFIWSDADGAPAFTKTDGVPAVLFSDLAIDSVPAGSVDLTIDPAEQVALAALAAHEAASNAHPQYVAHALFPDAQADMWMRVTGSANALVLTTPTDVRVPAYKIGQAFRFQAAYASTGAVTVNVNGLGVKPVVKSGGNALAPGDLRIGAIYDLIYDGTRFQLAGGVGGGQFYIEYPTVATAGQTVFNGSYTPGSEFTFINGDKLAKTEYTATDGSTVVLKTGVPAGTLITIVALSTFSVADTYSKGEYDSFAATSIQAKDKLSTVLNRWMSPQRTHEAITSRTQASAYDTTAGQLLVPGSFGAGALTLSAVASLNTLTAGGTYGWGATTTGAPVADYGEVLHLPGDTSAFATQIITSHYSNRVWMRRKSSGTWQAPVEIYHSANQLALGTTPATGRSALQLGAAALLATSGALYNALVGSASEAATTLQLVGLRDRVTPIANGGTGASNQADALANLGGQPLSAILTAFVANNGYGIGNTALTTVADFNALTVTGIYRYATGTLNLPEGAAAGTALHLSYGPTYMVQVCFNLGSGSSFNNQVYMRSMNVGVWGDWVQLARTDSPAFTGVPTAPTAALNTNSNQLATMAAVLAAINATGFGRYAILLGAVNIDTLDSNGSYYTATASTTTGTFPTGISGIDGAMLLHELGNSGAGKQTLSIRSAGRTWERFKIGNIWGAWREIAFTDSPTLLGTPTTPTPAEGLRTKQIANMEVLYAATRGRGLGGTNDLRNTIFVTGTPTDLFGTGLTMGLVDGPSVGLQVGYGVLSVYGGWKDGSAIESFSREFRTIDRVFVQRASNVNSWGPWVELAAGGDNVTISSLNDVTLKGTTQVNGPLNALGAVKLSSTLEVAGNLTFSRGVLGGSMEVGSLSVANTPYFDFHSSGKNIDYDSRIVASGGDGTIGGGSLSFTAADLKLVGAASVSNGLTVNNGLVVKGPAAHSVASYAAQIFTSNSVVDGHRLLLTQGNTYGMAFGLSSSGATTGVMRIAGVNIATGENVGIPLTLGIDGSVSTGGTLSVAGAQYVTGIGSFTGAVRAANNVDIGYQTGTAGARTLGFYSGSDTTRTGSITVNGTTVANSTMTFAATNLQINGQVNVAGSMGATGSITAAGGGISISSGVLTLKCMEPTNEGNLHIWAYNYNGTERALLYANKSGAWRFRHNGGQESLILLPDGNASLAGGITLGAYLSCGGWGSFAGNLSVTGSIESGPHNCNSWGTFAGNLTSGSNISAAGSITASNNLAAAGVVYSGNLASWLATDGNIYGPVWGGYLSTYLGNYYSQRGNIGIDYANYAGNTGGIGTYALMTNRTGGALNPGQLVAGASLTYANTEDQARNGGSPGVGTWRCMGTASANQNDQGTTLFLRIS